MSKYTTEVRYICEVNAGLSESVGYDDIESVIEKSRTKIFNFNYPIYDESYRSVLETKILKHYYTREIGLETVGLWKLKLDTKLNEIMPYYNQLYRSALLEFNPLYTTDLTREYKKDADGSTVDVTSVDSNRDIERSENEININDTDSKTVNSKNANENTSNVNVGTDKTAENNVSRDRYSDTPQGALTNIENDTYLTNARKITDENERNTETQNVSNNTRENTENGDSTTQAINLNEKEATHNTNDKLNESRTNDNVFTNTEAYLEHVYGFMNKDASELLLKFRKTFLNIDMQVIDELEELFLHLW